MRLRTFTISAAAVALVLAALGAFAWLTGALRLASVRVAYIPMAPSTAVGFVIFNTTLLALFLRDSSSVRRLALGSAGVLAALAGTNLVEFLTGSAILGLDAKLVPHPAEFGLVPLARMSPLTAVNFMVASCSLGILALAPRPQGRTLGGILSGFVALGGATVVLGYIFGAPLLYGGRIVPMAVTTGVAFVGTGLALIGLAGPESLPLRPFCGPSARARLMRVFVPLTVLAVLLSVVLINIILEKIEANPALVAAIFALLSAAGVGLAISLVARTLGTEIDRAQVIMQRSQEELERLVRERTAELTSTNRELESFSYSVSHDLRAPLRHVIGFASLLQRNAAQLDDRGQHLVTRIVEAGNRMSALIDDLLMLSRNTRTALDKRSVNLGVLLSQAQSDVVAQALGREVAWHVQSPLPDVTVDPSLFRQALVNLLSNALKYTRTRATASIEIGTALAEGNEVVLFVRDNGVGFDMAYAHKLFGVFQRLHTADEFEGTGIGLANVRRIVTRHGGRTWAESALGQGATFYVSLPN